MKNHNIVVRCFEDLYMNLYYLQLKFKINMHSFEINRIAVHFKSYVHKITSSKNDLSINVLYFSFNKLNLIDLISFECLNSYLLLNLVLSLI